jgi:hypothetical protein
MKKIFLNSTKINYGRPDEMYILNDLSRISKNEFISDKFVNFLSKNLLFKSKIINWDDCISILEKKLKKENFDLSIGIGNFGKMIIEDLKKRKIEMGKSITFHITRLSNERWEKIGYVNSFKYPTIKKQILKISKNIKNYKKIAIVDDITYSGGTRKSLSFLKDNNKFLFAIDLITINSAKNIKNNYRKWFSSINIKEDPYPTLYSDFQVDVMNASEFIYPSKNVGKITKGNFNENKILYNGTFQAKSYPYTSNKLRNQVYFGKKSNHICKKISYFRNKLKLS